MLGEFASKLVLGAICNWVYDLLLGHPLEFFKVAMQTQTYGSNSSYYEIFIAVTKTKGITALLDGFFPWGSLQALCKGAAFSFANAVALSALRRYQIGSRSSQPMLAGGIGGFVQGLILSPLLLLKTQVMTNPAIREAATDTWSITIASLNVGKQIVLKEGISGLSRGSLFFSIKRVFDWTSRYFFVGKLEEVAVSSSPNGARQLLMCSVVGGLLSTLVTMPMDLLVSISQQSTGTTSGEGSVMETILQQTQLTRGFAARALHVIFTTIVMRQIVPFVYDSMRMNKSTKNR